PLWTARGSRSRPGPCHLRFGCGDVRRSAAEARDLLPGRGAALSARGPGRCPTRWPKFERRLGPATRALSRLRDRRARVSAPEARPDRGDGIFAPAAALPLIVALYGRAHRHRTS